MPLFKAPIHVSYLLYLSCYFPWLARCYFRAALRLCRLAGVQPSLLLHPLDFLSGKDAPELKFFPGMNLAVERKLEFVSEILSTYTDKFDVVNMREHADFVRHGNIAAQPHGEVLL